MKHSFFGAKLKHFEFKEISTDRLYNKQRAFHISTSALLFYVMNNCFSAKESSAEVTFVQKSNYPPSYVLLIIKKI